MAIVRKGWLVLVAAPALLETLLERIPAAGALDPARANWASWRSSARS